MNWESLQKMVFSLLFKGSGKSYNLRAYLPKMTFDFDFIKSNAQDSIFSQIFDPRSPGQKNVGRFFCFETT